MSVIALLAALVEQAQPAGAAVRDCLATCRTTQRACVRGFKEQLQGLKAACTGDRRYIRQCKRAETKRSRAQARACGRFARTTCRACCRAGGPDCAVRCGDWVIGGAEACDDGNLASGDGCDANCTPTGCGNGIVTPAEQCETAADCGPDRLCVVCACVPRPVCGDGVVGPTEECDLGAGNSDEPDAACRTDCRPRRCGDGIVDGAFGEACEVSTDCRAGEACVSCACRTPVALGTRTFSVNAPGFFSSAFVSGTTSLGDLVGSLTLQGGPIGDGGIALVETAAGAHFVFVDLLGGVQGRVCRRISSCTGSVDCNGGTNVDVTVTLDSLARGATRPCEGPGVGSGNAPVVRTGVTATDSGPGAMLLTCRSATASVPAGTPCDGVTYGPETELALTSGAISATMLNPCPNPLGPATIAKTGEGFDCQAWESEHGPGRLVWVELSEEPSTLIAGDTANAGVLDD